MSVRQLPQFQVVQGTTWKPSHDEFGTSFQCTECGHNEFYKDEIPPPCSHKPEEYEKALHEKSA